MTGMRLLALLFVVALMTLGQILFKVAAEKVGTPGANLEFLGRLLTNVPLLVGIVVYGITTILWVIVLSDSNLSKSYPFVALTMVLVPIAGIVLFDEPFSPALAIGGALIIAGLVVIANYA